MIEGDEVRIHRLFVESLGLLRGLLNFLNFLNSVIELVDILLVQSGVIVVTQIQIDLTDLCGSPLVAFKIIGWILLMVLGSHVEFVDAFQSLWDVLHLLVFWDQLVFLLFGLQNVISKVDGYN